MNIIIILYLNSQSIYPYAFITSYMYIYTNNSKTFYFVLAFKQYIHIIPL